jgi:hypothetical protein
MYSRRALALLALLALGATVAAFARRVEATRLAMATVPGTSETSGGEEESLFAVWRCGTGLPVYTDAGRPPFSATYFNWLFYQTYGAAVRLGAKLSNGACLPMAGRWLTAACAALGAAGIAAAAIRLRKDAAHGLAAAALAAFAFCGPLVGWWAVTVRPDVAALLSEAAGILLFLLWHRDHPGRATAAALVAFYAAWSFKPTYLGGLVAVCAFLAAHRRWRDLASLAGGSAALWLLTFAVGGPLYRASLLDTATDNPYFFRQGAELLWHAGRISAPFIAGLPWWAAALARHKPWRHRSAAHDALLLASLGAPIVALLGALAASKSGAAMNYFFTPNLLLAIGTLCGLWVLERGAAAPILACALALALSGGTLGGAWGSLSLRSNADTLGRRWAVFSKLPEPRFADDRRLNLPWLNAHSPPLVYAFKYAGERARGRAFVNGGIGGMIERGELASLLLPQNTGDSYDQAGLGRYERGGTADGFTVFRLSAARPPSP